MTESLMVILEDGTKLIINEKHVVTVKKGKGKAGKEGAVLRLSTGETIFIKDPPYAMWENDCLTRKM